MIKGASGIENLLRESDLKVTAHRIAVLSLISKSKKPLSVFEIIDELRKKEKIDQATVYRNLASLTDAKIIRRFDFNHGHAHYDIKRDESLNQIICNKCETIENIEGLKNEDLIKKMVRKSKKFKSLDVSSTQIYGLCKKCS